MIRRTLIILGLALPCAGFAQTTISETTFGALEGRHIGPARMSGRVTSIDAVNADDNVVWVGTAGGGVWKSKNQGTTFKSVFDDYAQSIGAVCIDQRQPETVWVGTGEPWTRNSTGVGNGLYKTTNGGDKWTLVGLEKSERIAAILVDPRNSEVVYVAALGPLWGDGGDRGFYKTTDGGTTWRNTLSDNLSTGCADIVQDPRNPDIIYAALWDFRRTAYDFRSGGPGSGLYKSMDAGETWIKLTKDLPEGTLGRIALSISPVSPYYLYALVESDKSALYRSEDGGDSWKQMSTQVNMGERPFYFSNIVADPIDSNRVFKPGFTTLVSNDGGMSFSSVTVEGGSYHSDHHALWISPTDNRIMYVGTDGGVYVSVDRGNTWRQIQNLPVSQYYEIAIDNDEPYNVYGGLQDNGSWVGPSSKPGGIQNADWETVGVGDGFHCYPDRKDANIVYWQYQGGRLYKTDRKTGDSKYIKPFPDANSGDLRFNWNTPLVFSKTGDAMYVGAQYLYKSVNRGDSWERISPDLTTNDPNRQKQEESGGLTPDNSTAENNTTIISIAESPLNDLVIWAGTDDGNLYLTRNGGKDWTLQNDRLPDFPARAFISHIDAGNFREGTAFVTVDAHRNGDLSPYVYSTTDFGITWNQLATDDIPAYCYVIKQDVQNEDLLFLGTEMGLYLSNDRGASWVRYKGNVPMVAVHDLEIHPEKHDLILGTHGRGIIIIDDITPIRSLKSEYLDSTLVFLPNRPYYRPFGGMVQDFPGDQEFVGRNPVRSPVVTYYMKKRHVFGDMYMELLDSDSTFIRRIPAGTRKGLNRVVINTNLDPPKVPLSNNPFFAAAFGPDRGAGNYIIRVVKGDEVYYTQVEVLENPAFQYTAADRSLRWETQMKAYHMLEELAFIDEQIKDISAGAAIASEQLSSAKAKKAAAALHEKMEGFHSEIAATQAGEGAIVGQVRLREKIGEVYSAIGGYNGPPNQAQIQALDVYQAEMDALNERLMQAIKKDVQLVNTYCGKAKIEQVQWTDRESFFKEKTD